MPDISTCRQPNIHRHRGLDIIQALMVISMARRQDIFHTLLRLTIVFLNGVGFIY